MTTHNNARAHTNGARRMKYHLPAELENITRLQADINENWQIGIDVYINWSDTVWLL